MRLLIVNYEFPPVGAGAATASWFLARALARRGNPVSVVTSAFEEHRGISVEEGVRVHRIPALRRSIDRSNIGQMTCFAASGLLSAPRIARAERAEGVIAFFTLPSGIVGWWLKSRCGLPYVVSLRGGDVPGLVPEEDGTHRLVRGLRRKILRSARAIVANSQGLAELSLKTDPFPVAVIPNGVDSSVFLPEPGAAGAEDCFQILFAGRLREQKNLGLLLDELARLRHEGVAFRLHVAGDGKLGEALRQHARRLGLDGGVVWHGWIARKELLALYQSADCFVNPSLYEGLPNTVLEAMACGLPVVASRVPGNDALVVDRETGLLFSLEEPEQLGGALMRLERDRPAARQMGAAGRARAVEQFSWDAVAASYLRLLEPAPESKPGACIPAHPLGTLLDVPQALELPLALSPFRFGLGRHRGHLIRPQRQGRELRVLLPERFEQVAAL